jgi:hypothetical protein
MTPKEKALELVGRFGNVEIFISIEPTNIECKIKETDWSGTAKQCALIASDEIKEQLIQNLDNDVSSIHAIYWEKVKQEINKL